MITIIVIYHTDYMCVKATYRCNRTHSNAISHDTGTSKRFKFDDGSHPLLLCLRQVLTEGRVIGRRPEWTDAI